MKDNKTHATDTLKDLPHDPKGAMKRDVEQTKADMENMKDKVTGDDEDLRTEDM